MSWQTHNKKQARVKKYQDYEYLNTVWQVYNCAGGLNTNYLQRLFKIVHALFERSQRWFILRFDLHLKRYSKSNALLSTLRERLYYRIEKNIDSRKDKRIKQKANKHLAWVREQVDNKPQHYHCVIFLDGYLFDHPKTIMTWIKDIWADLTNGEGHVPDLEHPFYDLHLNDLLQRQRVLYRLSYLAKNASKHKPGETGIRYIDSKALEPKDKDSWKPKNKRVQQTWCQDLGSEWLEEADTCPDMDMAQQSSFVVSHEGFVA